MKFIRFIAGLWLVSATFFIWGMATIEYKVWPWKNVNKLNDSIRAFIIGHPDEPQTTPLQKLKSDYGGVPYRYIIKTTYPIEIRRSMQITPYALTV